jgi:hypothetical protein
MFCLALKKITLSCHQKCRACRKYATGLLYRHFDRLRFFFGVNGIIHLQLLYGPKFLRRYAVPIPRCI